MYFAHFLPVVDLMYTCIKPNKSIQIQLFPWKQRNAEELLSFLQKIRYE